MGRCPKQTHQTKKKFAKSGIRKKFHQRHFDQIWEDFRKIPDEVHSVKSALGPVGTTSKAQLDEDLPALGEFYCLACSRYFQSESILAQHQKTKPHKRRLKQLMDSRRPHNTVDAQQAGDMGSPDHGVRDKVMG